MAKLTWENAERSYETTRPLPLYAVDYKDNEELSSWLSSSLTFLEDVARERIDNARKNIALFKGVYSANEPMIGGRDYPLRLKKHPKLVINHTQDLVIQKVSKLTKSAPKTSVIPPSPELNDKLDSIIADEVLQSLKYENDVDLLYVNATLQAILEGETFVWVEWDPTKGDLHPDWKDTKKKKEKVPLTDQDGNEVKDVHGKVVYIDAPIYQGDVRYFSSHIWETFYDQALCPEEVQYVIRVEPVHVAELKALYPDIGHIESKSPVKVINERTYAEETLADHVRVACVYHRSGQFIEDGLFFKAIIDGPILEAPRPNPVSRFVGSDWGNLPCRRLTDIDVVGEIAGSSSVNNIAPLQDFFDKLTTLMGKNIFWASHAKALVTRGAVDKAELTNDSIIVNVKPGFPAPTFQTFPAFTADVFNFWSAIEQKMEKVFGIFSVSRGAPPPGTRAAASLYFYDEQETERSSLLQRKLNKLIVDVDRLTLSIISDNYEDHDNRLVKILGKDQQWMVKAFRVDSLKKSYDIRIENSPSLPTSRTARLQYLAQARQAAPSAISEEMFSDVLELGNYKPFIGPVRMAKFAAEQENDQILRGAKTPNPEVYEDHLTHWKEHVKFMQTPGFRDYSESIRDAFIDHVRAHEMFMDEFGVKSPAYGQMLMALPQFPIFWNKPAPAAAGQAIPEPSPVPQVQSLPQFEPLTNGAQLPNA